MEFIEAYVVATGEKVVIPDEWLTHPILGKPYRKTPSSRDAKNAEAAGAERVAVVESTTPAVVVADPKAPVKK